MRQNIKTLQLWLTVSASRSTQDTKSPTVKSIHTKSVRCDWSSMQNTILIPIEWMYKPSSICHSYRPTFIVNHSEISLINYKQWTNFSTECEQPLSETWNSEGKRFSSVLARWWWPTVGTKSLIKRQKTGWVWSRKWKSSSPIGLTKWIRKSSRITVSVAIGGSFFKSAIGCWKYPIIWESFMWQLVRMAISA